ncbi:hypothetical protein HID58_000589 [Brassica napus]|uniref:Uncharacterized protein n=1 Tax=Brassica napus TaxID=3708 RepID=A0ABQ8EGY0_BRANA|nr:trans-Golgi network-localized SYP41-interacting protein 1 isoform X1 [Brassica napus]KAH0940952.1 hypothetical protein HID58_000589 [Brassica napus]
MDKKKNRADPLAAGRQKLQQFRQKKADKSTDHKKDPKGSTSQGKSSKKSGKKHEPKPDTGGVSDEAEAPSDVAVGGASSHVNIGEEAVDPPPTSLNAAANSDVSADTLQPGNTTATSDTNGVSDEAEAPSDVAVGGASSHVNIGEEAVDPPPTSVNAAANSDVSVDTLQPGNTTATSDTSGVSDEAEARSDVAVGGASSHVDIGEEAVDPPPTSVNAAANSDVSVDTLQPGNTTATSDTSGVSDEAEAPSDVAVGGASSHVNIGEEAVDPPPTSVNAAANSDVSVDTLQPGNTTATSDTSGVSDEAEAPSDVAVGGASSHVDIGEEAVDPPPTSVNAAANSDVSVDTLQPGNTTATSDTSGVSDEAEAPSDVAVGGASSHVDIGEEAVDPPPTSVNAAANSDVSVDTLQPGNTTATSDTSGVSDEAEARSDVAVGGASSHVDIGEEAVDPPPTSVNAAANSDVSVDTLQPGNTTATSDSGDEPRKEVANSENDISVALSTEEGNVKSIDIGAAGAVDSLTSDPADTEKRVTHVDVGEEAEAPSDVAVGGASSHVDIGEEVVDPPPTSVNAAANSDVSVDTLQPGNTTATSDSGDEPRKEVANSENDISVALSTEEENVKSIDIGAAGAVDSLTSDPADTEKGVTHDDAEESLVALRSELQKRSNELEQSEQRLLSTREKLSIAVAKGKGLIVNRDNLKQLLAETSAELQRCSEELSLKDTKLKEVEVKLKTYTEAGERVEALESELSYIRNSATALRESFLLKDSLLHRIEEILEDLDLPEHFHAQDILDKVEWLARSANGSSLRPSDWDQKGSDGGAGYVPSEPCREDGQTGTSSENNLRIKFEELQGKFYGLAEHNEMLEQSLMHRNNLIQRWEALLGNIDMPLQLKSMEVENKIEWLASTISEAAHEKYTLQQKIDNLEVYCQSLTADLEVSQKQVSDVEANLRSVDHERISLSERFETLNGHQDNLSARATHLEVENEELKNQVKDLHGKLVEKLGNEEQLQTLEGDLLSLRDTITDVIEEDGLQDLAVASNSETLDVLLRKLIDYYKNLVKSSLPRERDDSFCETRSSNADVRSGESLGTHEATSHGHHPENIVEAASRDITVVESPDVASLTKDLDEALRVQKLVREERDLYMEKQQSLIAENEALDKKIIELQEFLKQEEQKSASAREKLNVAVRKGKALVQQRDSLKQTIEEMNAEHGRLKSEVIKRDEMLLENEKKFRELESYTVRVEVLESECQLLRNHLQETENILQERSDTLSMTLNALNHINIGDEGDRYDPVLKLQRISQLFQNMSTAVSSAEQESIKSRRAAELLLAEVNEVQERNDSMQEELSKCTYEIEQLSREKDAAEAATVEAISRFENLSMVNIEEKKKLCDQVLSVGTNVNSLRKIVAGTNSCLADIFTMNEEFLHHLKANMESCAKQTGTNLSGWPQGSKGNFVDKEIFSRLSAALSNVNLHENSNAGNITEICGSLSRNLDQFVADVSHLEENVSKHLASWQEQVNTVSTSIDTFFKSIGTGTDSEIAALGEKVSLLHGACSSVLAEIESRKAELVGNDNFNMSLHQVEEDFSSMESVRAMVSRVSSAVKELVVANAETVERNEKEMKVIIANLQRELHEKDIQNDRMCNELVGQVKEAQAGAKIFAEDLQSASARMHDMQDQLSILVRERDSLKRRVKELQEGQASQSELQEKVTSLSNLLAAKDQEIEALMQALDEEESQMEDLKHRVTELEQEVQQKNLDLQKAEASRGKISKKLSITVDKFDELHQLSENLLAEIEKLQQQVQDRDTEVSFLRQEVTRCTNEALVASQKDTKRDSEEIEAVLSWFNTIASLIGLEDSPSTDAQSHVNLYMEPLEKRIASMLSEMEELRLVGQSKDSLLEAERSRVAELRQKEAALERILHEKESQPNMSTSEIVEVEPLINKRTTSGASIPSQVRSLRKGNNDQVAISIDADQPDESLSLEDDDDKAHGFRSLTTSRVVPRFTRPVTNMIDGLWVSCDRTLMRQPALRLGIMIYWAILHALLASFVV